MSVGFSFLNDFKNLLGTGYKSAKNGKIWLNSKWQTNLQTNFMHIISFENLIRDDSALLFTAWKRVVNNFYQAPNIFVLWYINAYFFQKI